MENGRSMLHRKLLKFLLAIIITSLNISGCMHQVPTPPVSLVPSSTFPTEKPISPTPAKNLEDVPTLSMEMQLPDIASFGDHPSDQFILDAEGMSMVTRTYPYIGSGTSCAHHGAHLHFKGTGTPYMVNIYAPADGIIRMVTTCLNIGHSDRYGFFLDFARDGDNILAFDFSIEPQDGTPCDTDKHAYEQYIFVKDGERVQKGQILGQMYHTALRADGAHIHFDIITEYPVTFHCPNIFDATIEKSFASLFGTDVCGGVKFPATFCYMPSPGEDLTGRLGNP